jgi:cation diffusion facilitator family transporter
MSNPKSKAAAISIASNSFLILLKVFAGLLTGSISLIAEAVHSTMDLVASIIAFFSVRVSDRPADHEHPFGHGKAENISGVAEGLLIFVAAGIIVYEAVQRLIVGATLHLLEVGLVIMAVSVIVNVIVSKYLHRTSKRTDSLALEADAQHLSTDVLTMVGVFIGLALVRITGLSIFDPITAIVVALLIVKAAYNITRKSFSGLVDVRLPKEEEDKIVAAILEHTGQLAGFHDLRSRKSGSHRFVDLHLVMPRNISVEDAHNMCDHLEQDIKARLPNISMTIHVEPCETDCDRCSVACSTESRSDRSF